MKTLFPEWFSYPVIPDYNKFLNPQIQLEYLLSCKYLNSVYESEANMTPENYPIKTADHAQEIDDKIFKFKEAIKGIYNDLGYDKIPDDTNNLLEILPKIITLQYKKAKGYGRSYAKHGDLSIFFNLERKWDRIYNIMDKRMKGNMDSCDLPSETLLDTILDLGVYSFLWAGFIKEKDPQSWEEWVRRN